MGYCVFSREGQFRILKAYEVEALEALGPLGEFAQGDTLVEAIECAGWEVETPETFPDLYKNLGEYAIVHISHTDKWHELDEQMLECLAPFVEPGSYLEFEGEESERWRYWFDGQQLVEDIPDIIWHAPPVVEQRPPRVSGLAEQMRQVFDK